MVDNFLDTRPENNAHKGTPLYGQPSWWGEPESNDEIICSSTKKSIDYSQYHTCPNAAGAQESRNSDPEKSKTDHKYMYTYKNEGMSSEPSPPWHQARIPTSVSKDSLISLETKKEFLQLSGELDEKAEHAKLGKAWSGVGKPVEGGSMSFTVELGDNTTPKWNSSGKLSEFMPSKIRRSFRERSGKSVQKQNSKDCAPPKTDLEDLVHAKRTEITQKTPEKASKRSPKDSQSSEEELCVKGVKKELTKLSRQPVDVHGVTERDNEEQTKYMDSATFLIGKMFEGSTTKSDHSQQLQPLQQVGSYEECLEHNLADVEPYHLDDIFKKLEGNSSELDGHFSSEEKLSETGTYTIEEDVDSGEEEVVARKGIDRVFGVCQTFHRPIINEVVPIKKILSPDSDLSFSPRVPSSHNLEMEVQEQFQKDERDKALAVSQVKSQQGTSNSSHDTAGCSESCSSSVLTSKPPIWSPKKRPGTGRKLPSIPSVASDSPCSQSECTSQYLPLSKASPPQESIISGKKNSPDICRVENVLRDGRPKSPDSCRVESLLRDSGKVVAALKSKMSSFVKQKTVETASKKRESIEKKHLKNTQEQRTSISGTKNINVKKIGAYKTANTPHKTPSLRERTEGLISDDVNESDVCESQSSPSEQSTEPDLDNFSRRPSKGKGNITLTRPNRAFQLRRAKADGAIDSPEKPRSSSLKSAAQNTGSPKEKVKRRHSTNVPNTGSSSKSGVSAVSDNLRKSMENVKKLSNSSFARSDGGRHSLRVMSTASSLTSRIAPCDTAQKTTDFKALKSQLRNARSTPGLNLISISNNSRSQPASRSNSPKQFERNAWKRRKEYDQRKALLAEAKVKARQTKAQLECFENDTNTMIRSASFNSSLELYRFRSLRTDSTSSSKSETGDVFEDDLRHGFLPCVTLRTLHGGHSQEDVGARPPQSYDNIIISSIYQLTLKLKTATDRTIQKLRDCNRVSRTPSPVDDYLSEATVSEIPAWRTANQELAAILRNLRKIEHRIHVIDRVLFPDSEDASDTNGLTQREKLQYLQEIERIRNEIAGFQPIDNPEDVWKQRDNRQLSGEML